MSMTRERDTGDPARPMAITAIRNTPLGDPPPIRITTDNLDLLDRLLAARRGDPESRLIGFLRHEINRAEIVDDARAEAPFVTIGSEVLFTDETGRRYFRVLVLPGQLAEEPDGVSILSLVGTALLGMSAGQSIAFETRDGQTRKLTVLEVSAG